MFHTMKFFYLFTLTVAVGILIGGVSSSPFLTAWRSNVPAQCEVRESTHIGHPIHPPKVHCDMSFTEWFYKSGTCTQATYHGCRSAGGFHTENECKDTCLEAGKSNFHWYSWSQD